MAISPTLFLQEPTLKWTNHCCTHSQPQYPLHHASFTHFKHRPHFKNPRIKCFFASRDDSDSYSAANRNVVKFGIFKLKTGENPVEALAKSLMNAIKALQKPVAAAVLVGLLLMYDPNSALAASGGRVGGSAFSSGSSKSSASRSYSTSRMGRGPSVSYSVPFSGPSPFDVVYVGPAVGFGSSFFLIMFALAAFVLVSGFLSEGSDSSVLTDTEKTSVLKLQVGLLGMARSLQKDLNQIAETANTSTSEGLHFVLTETVLALLRHPDYCISAYSSVDIKNSMEGGEKRFNQLSIEERGKFDEETLVNVNNIKKQSSTILRTSGFNSEYIVITILVAAGGVHKLPPINGSKDLKDALQKLASIPSSRTLAVEVLWTPQNEDDTLSERELLEDYPLLRPL